MMQKKNGLESEGKGSKRGNGGRVGEVGRTEGVVRWIILAVHRHPRGSLQVNFIIKMLGAKATGQEGAHGRLPRSERHRH